MLFSNSFISIALRFFVVINNIILVFFIILLANQLICLRIIIFLTTISRRQLQQYIIILQVIKKSLFTLILKTRIASTFFIIYNNIEKYNFKQCYVARILLSFVNFINLTS